MKDLNARLAKIVDRFSIEDGFHPTSIPGAYCIKVSAQGKRAKNHWEACLGIVAQGCKEVVLGRDLYKCSEGHYIASPVELPVISRIAAGSQEKPFLCLLIHLDPLLLTEVAAQLGSDVATPTAAPQRAMFAGVASEPMLEAAIRLGKLIRRPEGSSVLGPLIVKEIIYHLLQGSEGSAIRQFVQAGSKMHKISQAIYRLRSELSHELNVESLAKAANMSRSAFFKHFKDVTAMSPIQYQKRLRLLEARRLMTEEGETAESSAYKTGYRSASQFSREYSRMFGNSPLRDAKKIKRTGISVQQI